MRHPSDPRIVGLHIYRDYGGSITRISFPLSDGSFFKIVAKTIDIGDRDEVYYIERAVSKGDFDGQHEVFLEDLFGCEDYKAYIIEIEINEASDVPIEVGVLINFELRPPLIIMCRAFPHCLAIFGINMRHFDREYFYSGLDCRLKPIESFLSA